MTEQPSNPTTPQQAVRALARMSRVLERSSPGLSLAHYRVLSAIAAGDERASRVAARLALGRPTVSAAVDALCKRGLVERADVEGDQRAAALSLTEDGAATLEQAEAQMIERVVRLCSHTPDGDAVLRCLAWLDPAIDKAIAERHSAVEQARTTVASGR